MLADCTRDLSYVSVACCPDSAIEKSIDCFHADFANALVGGSVLFGGFAQEEIRFLIAPECLITILLCEKMEDKESILIRGSEQFSTYMGYGHNFSCTGPYDGLPPRMDDSGFLCTFVVAMDATPFDGDGVEQYDAAHSHREITKERGCGMVFEERGGLERGAFIAQYNVGIEDDPINVSTLYQWTMEYAVSRTADDGGELSVFDFIARKMRNDD
ncbi:parg-1 [Symbiodinium microadriaticum]|nr:parg-1 [Symbiodinium microadriaticum]